MSSSVKSLCNEPAWVAGFQSIFNGGSQWSKHKSLTFTTLLEPPTRSDLIFKFVFFFRSEEPWVLRMIFETSNVINFFFLLNFDLAYKQFQWISKQIKLQWKWRLKSVNLWMSFQISWIGAPLVFHRVRTNRLELKK